MSAAEKLLVAALEFIRDSTFRDAATLRAYADKALNEYRAGDYAAALPVDRRAMLIDRLEGAHDALDGDLEHFAAIRDALVVLRAYDGLLDALKRYQRCNRRNNSRDAELFGFGKAALDKITFPEAK